MERHSKRDDTLRNFWIPNEENRIRFWLKELVRERKEEVGPPAVIDPRDFPGKPGHNVDEDARFTMALKKSEVLAIMGMVEDLSK